MNSNPAAAIIRPRDLIMGYIPRMSQVEGYMLFFDVMVEERALTNASWGKGSARVEGQTTTLGICGAFTPSNF